MCYLLGQCEITARAGICVSSSLSESSSSNAEFVWREMVAMENDIALSRSGSAVVEAARAYDIRGASLDRPRGSHPQWDWAHSDPAKCTLGIKGVDCFFQPLSLCGYKDGVGAKLYTKGRLPLPIDQYAKRIDEFANKLKKRGKPLALVYLSSDRASETYISGEYINTNFPRTYKFISFPHINLGSDEQEG